jgi:hypothetical protein
LLSKDSSLLIHKIIKEKSWLLTKLQELLQLKVAFIVDSPAVRAKVMGTQIGILSGHCKDEDVQIYWNCISYAQDVNIFTMPNGKR